MEKKFSTHKEASNFAKQLAAKTDVPVKIVKAGSYWSVFPPPGITSNISNLQEYDETDARKAKRQQLKVRADLGEHENKNTLGAGPKKGMPCGLDFGTTNSSITYFINGHLTFGEINKGFTSVPSAAWFSVDKEKIDVVVSETEINTLYQKRFRGDTAGGSTVSARRQAIKKYLIDQKTAEISTRLSTLSDLTTGSHTRVGIDALSSHKQGDHGLLVKSPKSIIGHELNQSQVQLFQDVIARMLTQYKRSIEENSSLYFDSVVIGRPITWSVNPTKEKDRVSESIMKSAAIAAGFKNVEFQLEPLAAATALEDEYDINQEIICLVVDIGGGTTDVAMVTLGNKREREIISNNRVIAYEGIRFGGVDLDIALGCRQFGRELGIEYFDNSGEIIKSCVSDFQAVIKSAFFINDYPAQRKFKKEHYNVETACNGSSGKRHMYLSRLLKLYDGDMNIDLILEAERLKIGLSSCQDYTADLSFLERGCKVKINKDDFIEAISYPARQIKKAIDQVLAQGACQPDKVLITGGGSLSTGLIELLGLAKFHGKIVTTDRLTDVVKGLGITAGKIF
jgi:hypothetical chaperone protein